MPVLVTANLHHGGIKLLTWAG